MSEKENILTRTWMVVLLASICCILWGSAIPAIKTGYRLLEVESSDTASQIVFAGIRFSLAGLLVLLFGTIREKKIMLPEKSMIRYIVPVCLAQTLVQCPYVRSEGWHYYRNRELYCNSDVMSGGSK